MVERLNVYSERYGWVPRAGARVVERGAVVTVNARGLRGTDWPTARGARARLALAGDSMAFGHGVGDEETFAARLQQGRTAFEVVNLGVEGYGPDQAALRFEHEGRAYAPDAVVVSVCVDNDFADAGLPVFLYDGRYPKPYYELEGGELVLRDRHLRLGGLKRLGLRLSESSRLYGLLAGWLRPPVQAAPEAEGWRVRRQRVESDPARAVELVARILERLRDVAAAGAPPARLLVLLHPSKESYNHGSRLADRLATRLTAAGIETLDLAADFRRRGLRFADFAFDPTGHPNAHGHEVIAEALRARLGSTLAPP